MNRNQAWGTLIAAICIAIALAFTGLFFFYDPYIASVINLGSAADVRFGLVETLVHTAVFAFLAIGAWIGYNLATMPSPKIFDITKEPITETKPTPT